MLKLRLVVVLGDVRTKKLYNSFIRWSLKKPPY